MLLLRNCRGITFLEILMALSIVIILAIASTPTFLQLYQEHHLETTAINLYNALQYARSEATKNNTTVYAVFQTGDSWCFGTKVGSSCSCNVANSCTLANYAAVKTQDISLSLTGVTANTIQFDGIRGGTLTGGLITFTLYGQTKALSVKVSALGNLQLCSSTMSGYTACS